MDEYQTAQVAVATVLCNDPGWQQGDMNHIRILDRVWTYRRNDLRYELSGTVDEVLAGTWRVEQFDNEGCAEPSAKQVWLIHFRETSKTMWMHGGWVHPTFHRSEVICPEG